MSEEAGQLFGGHRRTLRVGAALWLVAAPWFFFVPTGYDGLHTRMKGLVGFVSVAALSHLPIVAGRIVLVAQGRGAFA